MDYVQLTGSEPEFALSAVRQWACFPQFAKGQASVASPQTFRVLVESASGRLAIVTLTLRMAPDRILAAGLGSLIDEIAFANATRERIAGEFEARHGLAIEMEGQDEPGAFTGTQTVSRFRECRDYGTRSPGSRFRKLLDVYLFFLVQFQIKRNGCLH